MIKRVIGILVALVTIAVIVISALNRDCFSSLFSEESTPAQPVMQIEPMEVLEEVDPWGDSVAEPVVVDSAANIAPVPAQN